MPFEMKKYIPYIIIAVLLVALGFSLTNRKEVVIERTTSDTVVIVKLDTVKVKIPTFIRETIVDTILIEKDEKGSYLIPITQKYYKDESYEAWVSGYRPNLDSINTFSKTTTQAVTNTTTREIYPKTTDYFIFAGSDYIKGKFTPNVGAAIKFKNGVVIGANVGYYDKGVYYGAKIGYKLNKK